MSSRRRAIVDGIGLAAALPVAAMASTAQPVRDVAATVNVGSPTFPLDISAALTPDRKTLTIAAVNAAASEQSLRLDLGGFHAGAQGRAWKMTGTNLDAAIQVARTPQVSMHETTFDAGADHITVAPHSVEIYAFAAG